jgi:hypothetical protein
MKKLLQLLLVRNLLPPRAKKKKKTRNQLSRDLLSLSLSLSLPFTDAAKQTPRKHAATKRNARAVGPFFQLHQQPSTRAQKDGSWMISEPEPTNQPTQPRSMKDEWMISELQPIHHRTNDGWMDGWMIRESEPIYQRTMKEGWMMSELELDPPAHHDVGMIK